MKQGENIMKYDLIVLGGGPGGYLAAERAGAAGLSTLLVEKRQLGGVCLNEGCIPTKTLLHSAKLLEGCRNAGPYGVTCEHPALHHGEVLSRKDKVVRRLVAGVKSALRECGVDVLMGEGRIAGKSESGILVSAGGAVYTGANLVIATGSRPALPPLPGLEKAMGRGFVLTSSGILSLREPPEKLVVIGGGAVGLEMAYYFSAAGSAVTVVELLPDIAGGMDEELSLLLRKNLEGRGVAFRLSARVSAVTEGAVAVERNGAAEELPCDRVLLCVGRRPVTEGIGLEALPVTAINGGIETDSLCRTNVPNVYAVGDCNGRSMLAHTAYREAEVAVNTILGLADEMSYRAIPSVVYTCPEAAAAGLAEKAAREQGVETAAVRLSMNYSGRYQAEQERGDGICKLIFDRQRRTLVGAHLLGGPASELIFSCGMLIESRMPLEQMKRFVFPHPTVGEIIREGLFRAEL